ncbi:MAG: hypothetical protein KDA24_25955 [Deltaproteobacteria bacterium]|nr:hypothetical protein [Deltaproteobacteria bacterium]
MRLLSLLLAAGLVTVATPALADIVLHDGGVERDREVSELVEQHTQSQPRMVLSGDVLAGPTRMLASNVEVEQCEGSPIELNLGPKLEAVVESVLSFELDRAIGELDTLETLLPCASAPVMANELARISFLRGAALLDMGDEPGARVAMSDSIAQEPSFEGIKGFPKAHSDLLATLKTEATDATPGGLYVWHKAGTVAEVLIDGVVAPDPGSKGASLAAGRHLVQSRDTEGVLRGMWVRTTGIDSVVAHPGSGRLIWSDGGRSPGGEMAMRLLLLSEFQGRDGDIHVLRFKGRKVVSAATFPADGSVRQVWDKRSEPVAKTEPTEPKPAKERPASTKPAKKERTTANRSSVRPSRVRFALGGGYQYVHPFSYGMVSADLGVRLVGPLTVTVFARPSFGGQFTVDLGEGDPVEGAILLVPFGAGLGIQKHDGPIGPFVFASFQAAPNQVIPLGSLMIGAAVQGGVDFAPGDGPFIVRVEGEAGFLGANDDVTGSFFAGFTGRIGVGVGARF